jgi:hypothetical protein
MTDAEHELKERAMRQDILIREYDICARRADFHTNLIWTWGTLLVSANGAALALLHNRTQPVMPLDAYFAFLIVGWAGSAAIWWWHAACNRWHEIIVLQYERMNDIESECGLGGNRYIRVHDNPDAVDKALQVRLRRATGRIRKGNPDRLIGPQALRTKLCLGIPLVWAAAAAVRAFAVAAGGSACIVSVQASCAQLRPGEYGSAIALACVGAAILFGTWLIFLRWLVGRPVRATVAETTKQKA